VVVPTTGWVVQFDANGEGRHGFISRQGVDLVREGVALEVGHTHAAG
jgi:hypothetical protein